MDLEKLKKDRENLIKSQNEAIGILTQLNNQIEQHKAQINGFTGAIQYIDKNIKDLKEPEKGQEKDE